MLTEDIMTNYYEEEIQKYYGSLDELNKKKEELEIALKKIEEEQEFVKRQIKSIEKILAKEKENNPDFSKLKDGFITTPEDEKLVNQLRQKLTKVK